MSETEILLEENKLIYVSDSSPGITRVVVKGTFAYINHKGEKLTDSKTLERIKKLVLPPA